MTCLGNVGPFTGNCPTNHASPSPAYATKPLRSHHLLPSNRNKTATSAALYLVLVGHGAPLGVQQEVSGQLEFDPTAASLGKLFHDNYLSLSAVGNDICTNDTPSARPPSLRNLLRSSFGRLSASHFFVQDACFETLYVLVLKSGFFKPADIMALHQCHPLLSHLLCTCVHSRHYDFLWLAQYNIDWAKQQSLNNNTAYAFLACLLHYNLSVALSIRFLGNNYTGIYRDIPSIVNSLRTHGIAESLISHYS